MTYVCEVGGLEPCECWTCLMGDGGWVYRHILKVDGNAQLDVVKNKKKQYEYGIYLSLFIIITWLVYVLFASPYIIATYSQRYATSPATIQYSINGLPDTTDHRLYWEKK